MLRTVRTALVSLGLLTLITGVLYPVTVTLLAQAMFARQANGSLIHRGGGTIGSTLIGQAFADPRYFWSRPSATRPAPYNAGSSSGSNLGPLNPVLLDAVMRRAAALRAADPSNAARIPVDLVTSSGSGLDPHISPASAYWQVPRVARTRALPEQAVRALVAQHIEGRLFMVIGEPRVNVLRLNLDLDALHP